MRPPAGFFDPRPQFGAPSIEPEFSTPIVAITETGADEAIVPVPGGAPPWNADGSLLMMYEMDRGPQLRRLRGRQLQGCGPADLR